MSEASRAPGGWMGQTLLGRYRVEQRLGAGGMAAVYEASDLNLKGRRVVVKHPLREADRAGSGLTDADLRERFEREIERLIALDDVPGVVPILAQGVHEGTPFYVMRYMAGGSLLDLLRAGPQGPEDALRWARPVAEALDAVHARGVIHRDIKPGNILFDKPPTPEAYGSSEPPRAFVADFGIVRELSAAWATTGHNTMLGTPGYMAPEQTAPDGEVDGSTDQYALAATLYQALTGSVPAYVTTTDRSPGIAGRSAGQERRGPRKRLRPLHELAAHVPAAAAAAVERGLAREQGGRFQTCRALVRAVSDGLVTTGFKTSARGASMAPTSPSAPQATSGPEHEPGGGAPRTASHPIRRGVAVLALVGAVVVGTLALLPGPSGSPPSEVTSARVPRAPDRSPPIEPIPLPDVVPPQILLFEPATADTTTTEASVTLRGRVEDAGDVTLQVGAERVAIAADRTFRHEVPLEVGEQRTLTLSARDAAGNASAPVERIVRRERKVEPWEAALAEARTAVRARDGRKAKGAFQDALDAGLPEGKVPRDLREFLARWDAPPTLTIAQPAPGSPHAWKSVVVAGTLATERPTDVVYVQGAAVALEQGAFKALARLPGEGSHSILVTVMDVGEERARVELKVVVDPIGASPPWARLSASQESAARRLCVPVGIDGPLGTRFVLIPDGETTFTGTVVSDEGAPDRKARQTVRSARPFYLQTTEVTNEQWSSFRAGHQSKPPGWEYGGDFEGPQQPVCSVTFEDATAFVAWLRGKSPALGLRLPTAGEWHYAAQGGATTEFFWGDQVSEAGAYAVWCYPCALPGQANVVPPAQNRTADVASVRASPWGLFDMLGNVWEWVDSPPTETPSTGLRWMLDDVAIPTAALADVRALCGGDHQVARQHMHVEAFLPKDRSQGSFTGHSTSGEPRILIWGPRVHSVGLRLAFSVPQDPP